MEDHPRKVECRLNEEKAAESQKLELEATLKNCLQELDAKQNEMSLLQKQVTDLQQKLQALQVASDKEDKNCEYSTANLNDKEYMKGHYSCNTGNNVNCDDWHTRITELTVDEILGLEFASDEEACQFYDAYARCKGFVMRKDDKLVVNGILRWRNLVCNREGATNEKRTDPESQQKSVNRTKCPARFRVHLNSKTSKYTVSRFNDDHNHNLTPAEHIHLIPAYRDLSVVEKSQVDSLYSFGVRSCHIIGYLVGQKGGLANTSFINKDVYNYVDRQKRAKVKDGDGLAAMGYLQAKADNDPMFFGVYTLDNEHRLHNVFWADGRSILDYACFGDVLAFDTTYKKNKYNKPLVIFSGCNHHSQTIIFGCALVSDETIDTYKWLLTTFLEAMNNKHPKAVVTDGDGAMREAIKQVFSDSTHRLCAWHLQKNACENVKSSSFLTDFKRMIYSNYTPVEFEVEWKNMVDKHGLSDNNWVTKTYENKSLWAAAYLRDNFLARFRTTSQCEGINSLISSYVRRRNYLIEFMQNLDRALREYRNNEMIADFKSSDSDPKMTTSLRKFEASAAKNFTREIFYKVKTEIDEVAPLISLEPSINGDNVEYKMCKFGNPEKEYRVMYDKCNRKFLCDCRMFESQGLPCRHIFCAMRDEHMEEIPESLICKRWTKNAKSDFISSIPTKDLDKKRSDTFRLGCLGADCHRLCNLVYENVFDFLEVRDDILRIIKKIEARRRPSQPQPETEQISFGHKIGDPLVIKSKGAPRKKKANKKIRKYSKSGKTCQKKGTKRVSQDDINTSIEDERSPTQSEPFTEDLDMDMNEEPLSDGQTNVEHTTITQSSKMKEKSMNVGHEASKRKEGDKFCSSQVSTKLPSKKNKIDESRSGEHSPVVSEDVEKVEHNISHAAEVGMNNELDRRTNNANRTRKRPSKYNDFV